MSPEIVPNRLLMTDSGRAPYLEAPARAIAAVKRGKKPDDPEIDRVWPTYVGQAKACVLAFLEESAAYRKSLKQPKQRYVTRGRGLTTSPNPTTQKGSDNA
jgi:hypothetical protein